MLSSLESLLMSYIESVPLHVFVFVASFIEEVIAPIPSPTVMITSGAAAAVQGYTPHGILILAILGTAGKTLGALLLYTIAYRAEHFVLRKFGRLFRFTEADVARVSAKLGNGIRDYVVLTVLRALPFIQSGILSLGSGLLKVPMRLYLTATIIGTFVKETAYLAIGYAGLEALSSLMRETPTLETLASAALVLTLILIFGYVYYTRNAREKKEVPTATDETT